MILKKLMTLICDELGVDRGDINASTLLEELVADEFEMGELIQLIEAEFEVELQTEPDYEWSVEDLANAVSDAE